MFETKKIKFYFYFACAVLIFINDVVSYGNASDEARVISLYHIHTKEELTILYKKNGKYIPEALKKLNWILRDWRKNEVIEIDPKAIDLAWEMHEELGSRIPIHIICGYRAHDTNEMLRKSRGGQAKKSQHISGKAIDLSFPDIPIRRLRYSAMIRENGGVGYYPTSAIPFVHIDTGNVRSWPRMPHVELALLFPNGHSKHVSSEGKTVQHGDYLWARKNKPQLAEEVTRFFDELGHSGNKVLIASAEPPSPLKVFKNVNVQRSGLKEIMNAGGEYKQAFREVSQNNGDKIPHLIREPRLVERSSHFTKSISTEDRTKLTALVSLTALSAPSEGIPRLVSKPRLLSREDRNLSNIYNAKKNKKNDNSKSVSMQPSLDIAKMNSNFAKGLETDLIINKNLYAMSPNAWVVSPAFDEDHPDELFYQPFPILPLLTNTSSPNDPNLAHLIQPNLRKILTMIDDEGIIAPMRFRPGIQTAQLFFSQKFTGKVVDLTIIEDSTSDNQSYPPSSLIRRVKTTSED